MQCDYMECCKDEVYKERNLCVALAADLARGHGFLTWIAPHQGDEEWDEEWKHVLFVYLPGVGQVSWHLHENELVNFRHIPRVEEPAYAYDGHSTEEKYNRIKQFCSVF